MDAILLLVTVPAGFSLMFRLIREN